MKSTPLTRSAYMEECTLNIVESETGVTWCNYNPETTVMCHFPLGEGGSNKLNGDLCAGYGCSECHSVIDGRVKHSVSQADLEFFMRRSQLRTLQRLIEKGFVRVTT